MREKRTTVIKQRKDNKVCQICGWTQCNCKMDRDIDNYTIYGGYDGNGGR